MANEAVSTKEKTKQKMFVRLFLHRNLLPLR